MDVRSDPTRRQPDNEVQLHEQAPAETPHDVLKPMFESHYYGDRTISSDNNSQPATFDEHLTQTLSGIKNKQTLQEKRDFINQKVEQAEAAYKSLYNPINSTHETRKSSMMFRVLNSIRNFLGLDSGSQVKKAVAQNHIDKLKELQRQLRNSDDGSEFQVDRQALKEAGAATGKRSWRPF